MAASANVTAYVGESDIIMIPSIVDVQGINAISETIFRNAACAIAGMLNLPEKLPQTKREAPLIAATMFGVTTPCVAQAQKYLEEKGYELVVFHATGAGGRSMESLVESGYFAGVLDLTTTELCDELCGGILTAGPHRLEAAANAGIPQIISLGALDMVNFGALDTVPEKYAQRNLYEHNKEITLMRTTVEENRELGRILAQKLNKVTVPTILLIPKLGISAIDAPGQPFYDPAADDALFTAIRETNTNPLLTIEEIDAHINDESFANMAAQKMIELMENR